MVVHQEMPSVGERNGVDTGVGIRQGRCGHSSPSFSVIFRPYLEYSSLSGAPQSLKSPARMHQDRGLDGTEPDSIIHGRGFVPCEAKVGGRFKMDAPAMVLGAAGTE